FRALPADQRLDPDDAAGLELDLGLVVKNELFLLQRLAQFALQRELLGDPLGHFLVEEEVALACRFGLLQSGLGAAQKGFGIVSVIREYRDSIPRRNLQVMRADAVRRTEAGVEP